MVVQPGERNAYDQQWLQTRLWERHGVRTLRRTLAQVGASGQRRGCWGRVMAACSGSFQPWQSHFAVALCSRQRQHQQGGKKTACVAVACR